MANNRVAYGLAKEYGIDTTGKSPKEVWEALKGKGINQDNFQQYQNRQNKGYSQKPRTKASETYRLSYSGEEIPKIELKGLAIQGLKGSNWDYKKSYDQLDMAIKDGASSLLDKYEDMSYEEAIEILEDTAKDVVDSKVWERYNKYKETGE